MLLLLEDNTDRVRRFRSAWEAVQPGHVFMVWRRAVAMIREVAAHLAAARIVSLDRDLVAQPGEDEPGDGLEVALFLVTQPTPRPVIIHSSNSARAESMMGPFELACWRAARVLPFGDRWIEDAWAQVVKERLRA